jgi:hypothetical protein
MAKLEAGQLRDNAEAAHEQKAAESQFGQSLGRIESTDVDLATPPGSKALPIN